MKQALETESSWRTFLKNEKKWVKKWGHQKMAKTGVTH